MKSHGQKTSSSWSSLEKKTFLFFVPARQLLAISSACSLWSARMTWDYKIDIWNVGMMVCFLSCVRVLFF